VRNTGLESFQVGARVFRALSAKVDAFISGAFVHPAKILTIKGTLFRAAAVALQLIDWLSEALSHPFKPRRIFMGADIR
jgi:hypothetical protein